MTRNGPNQEGEQADGWPSAPDRLSRATVHDLLGRLATIKGHAQLIRRRMRDDTGAERERTLASLAAMDGAINDLVAALNALREPSQEREPAPEETPMTRR